MGLGYGSAYGLAAVKDELLQLVAQRKQEEAIKQHLAQQEFLNRRLVDRDAEQSRQFDVTQQRLGDDAAASRELAIEGLVGNRANQITDEIPPDASIDPQTAGVLRAGGRGALVKENAPYAYPGFLRSALPGAERDVVPGEQEGAVFTGTAGQRFQRDQAMATNRRAEADDVRADAAATEARRHNRVIENRAPASESRPQWVTRGGGPVYTADVQPGDAPYSAPRSTSETAQDRQRSARVQAARGFLGKLNQLREKINTKMGPAAGATGLFRRGRASIGLDPDVAEYERERAAGGRSLAVAIMGAQNLSDADAKAWADMLPGATVDKETARRLMEQVESMLNGLDADVGGAPVPNGGSETGLEFDFVPGRGLVPRGGQ